MLDLQTARDIVREIVEEVGPDFRYIPEDANQQCFYVQLTTVIEWVNNNDIHPGAEDVMELVESSEEGVVTFYPDLPKQTRYHTACLVGRVLDRAGETRHRHPAHIIHDVRELSKRYPDMFTEEAVDYLQLLQASQDLGRPWSQAHQLAEQSLEGVPVL